MEKADTKWCGPSSEFYSESVGRESWRRVRPSIDPLKLASESVAGDRSVEALKIDEGDPGTESASLYWVRRRTAEYCRGYPCPLASISQWPAPRSPRTSSRPRR
jgi:hypothetical protein